MQSAGHLDQYLSLLQIRLKAYRRNLFISGAIFLLALVFTTITLLLTEWNDRTLWMMGMFDVIFAVNFLMTWSRMENTRDAIEMLSHISPGEG